MSALTGYKGLQIVSPTPTGAAGIALNNNFTAIADSLDTKIDKIEGAGASQVAMVTEEGGIADSGIRSDQLAIIGDDGSVSATYFTAQGTDAGFIGRGDELHHIPQSGIVNLPSDLAAKASAASLTSHTSNVSNPHSVTKAQVGLSNVLNLLQLQASLNLSDLTNVTTARTNLGLGSAALSASTDFAAASHTQAQSTITNLTTDLAAKAPLASPTFTGVVSGNGSGLTALNASSISTGTIPNARTTATASATPNTIALRNNDGLLLAVGLDVSGGGIYCGSLVSSGTIFTSGDVSAGTITALDGVSADTAQITSGMIVGNQNDPVFTNIAATAATIAGGLAVASTGNTSVTVSGYENGYDGGNGTSIFVSTSILDANTSGQDRGIASIESNVPIHIRGVDTVNITDAHSTIYFNNTGLDNGLYLSSSNIYLNGNVYANGSPIGGGGGSSSVINSTSGTNTIDAGAPCGFPAFDFNINDGGNGTIFRIGEYSLAGTNDLFFQGLPNSSGYTYFEDWSGAGLCLGTGGATPISFRPARTEMMKLTSEGGLVLIPTSEPASAEAGMIYFDSSTSKHRGFNGSSWNDLY